MTALSDDRSLDQVSFGAMSMLQLGLKASETLYTGSAAAVADSAAGYLCAAGSEASGPVLGVASARADNSSGANGAASSNLAQGIFRRVNSSTSALAQTDAPCVCYAEDDQTVRKNPTATSPICGVFLGFEADGTTPLVFISAANNIALSLGGGAVAPLTEKVLDARYVMTTNVADVGSFTVAQDGVTGVEGDVVLLAGQTSKDENGLYVLGAVAAGSAALTRDPRMPAGAELPSGSEIHVDAGTVFADTVWFCPTAGLVTIGTDNHDWYPRSVSQTAVLVAGTVTISNVPILSATKSAVLLNRHTADTSTATTGGYHATVAGANGITAGVVGTGQAVIQACVAAGTINAADVSTLHVTIIN